MAQTSLKYYIDRYLQGNLTPEESRELMRLLNDEQHEKELDDIMDAQLLNWSESKMQFPEVTERIQRKVQEKIREENRQQPGLRVAHRNRKWYAAAASFLVLLSLGYYLFYPVKTIPAIKETAASLTDIKAPQSNRATITLSDGSVVYLDSAGNGQLAVQGGIQLIKLASGKIAYQTASGEIINEVRYNTLTNPRGSKVVDITLSDGSRVWLNAGSSITYPIAFVGGERNVTLKGEGYFEVQKDPAKKFIVTCGGIQTEVLGTRFNIDGYTEDASKITLLEGSIKISGSAPATRSKILKPGQQTQVGRDWKTIYVNEENVMSWKSGYFSLDGLSFTEIMNQLERWYDIEVVYSSGVPNIGLFGKIGRDLSLAEVANSLGDMGVSCRIEHGRLIIK